MQAERAQQARQHVDHGEHVVAMQQRLHRRGQCERRAHQRGAEQQGAGDQPAVEQRVIDQAQREIAEALLARDRPRRCARRRILITAPAIALRPWLVDCGPRKTST